MKCFTALLDCYRRNADGDVVERACVVVDIVSAVLGSDVIHSFIHSFLYCQHMSKRIRRYI